MEIVPLPELVTLMFHCGLAAPQTQVPVLAGSVQHSLLCGGSMERFRKGHAWE